MQSVTRESDPCILLINLHGDSAGFKVQVDSAATAKEVANVLEERREGEGIVSREGGSSREEGGRGISKGEKDEAYPSSLPH